MVQLSSTGIDHARLVRYESRIAIISPSLVLLFTHLPRIFLTSILHSQYHSIPLYFPLITLSVPPVITSFPLSYHLLWLPYIIPNTLSYYIHPYVSLASISVTVCLPLSLLQPHSYTSSPYFSSVYSFIILLLSVPLYILRLNFFGSHSNFSRLPSQTNIYH